MGFSNSYEDPKRAEAYAKLEFPGTYYLAYRDLPAIIVEHVNGKRALDFGCGAGRSTRFLRKLGFETVGVDISMDMLKRARERDSGGDYHLIGEGDFSQFKDDAFDLVLSAFTFDKVPTLEKKVRNFNEIRRMLKSEGRMVNLISSPEIYKHEWALFSTKDFPENKQAKSGDKVKIVQTDLGDKRPVVDVVWTDESYRIVYRTAGLAVVKKYEPLAKEDEPYKWIMKQRLRHGLFTY